jgi:hypothetical protein
MTYQCSSHSHVGSSEKGELVALTLHWRYLQHRSIRVVLVFRVFGHSRARRCMKTRKMAPHDIPSPFANQDREQGVRARPNWPSELKFRRGITTGFGIGGSGACWKYTGHAAVYAMAGQMARESTWMHFSWGIPHGIHKHTEHFYVTIVLFSESCVLRARV